MKLKKLVAVLLTVLTLISSAFFMSCNKDNVVNFNDHIESLIDYNSLYIWSGAWSSSPSKSYDENDVEAIKSFFSNVQFERFSKKENGAITEEFKNAYGKVDDLSMTFFMTEFRFTKETDKKFYAYPIYIDEDGYLYDFNITFLDNPHKNWFLYKSWYKSTTPINFNDFIKII